MHYKTCTSRNQKEKDERTYCIPPQFVQTNVQKFVQTYCGPCLTGKKEEKSINVTDLPQSQIQSFPH